MEGQADDEVRQRHVTSLQQRSHPKGCRTERHGLPLLLSFLKSSELRASLSGLGVSNGTGEETSGTLQGHLIGTLAMRRALVISRKFAVLRPERFAVGKPSSPIKYPQRRASMT